MIDLFRHVLVTFCTPRNAIRKYSVVQTLPTISSYVPFA